MATIIQYILKKSSKFFEFKNPIIIRNDRNMKRSERILKIRRNRTINHRQILFRNHPHNIGFPSDILLTDTNPAKASFIT